MRLIIYETKGVVFKDEIAKCNDLFAKAILGKTSFETDTHWRCRNKGSFNWRMKFPLKLPLDPDEDYGGDVLKVSQCRHLTYFTALIMGQRCCWG